jgi:hypothetical protein
MSDMHIQGAYVSLVNPSVNEIKNDEVKTADEEKDNKKTPQKDEVDIEKEAGKNKGKVGGFIKNMRNMGSSIKDSAHQRRQTLLANTKEGQYDEQLLEKGWAKEVQKNDRGERTVNYTKKEGDKEYKVSVSPKFENGVQRQTSINGDIKYADNGQANSGRVRDRVYSAGLDRNMNANQQSDEPEGANQAAEQPSRQNVQSPMTEAMERAHTHQRGNQQLDEYSTLAANSMADFLGVDPQASPDAYDELKNNVRQNTVMAEGYESGAIQYIPGSGMPSPEEVKQQQERYNQAAAKGYRDQNGLPPESQQLQEFSQGNNAMLAAKDIRENQPAVPTQSQASQTNDVPAQNESMSTNPEWAMMSQMQAAMAQQAALAQQAGGIDPAMSPMTTAMTAQQEQMAAQQPGGIDPAMSPMTAAMMQLQSQPTAEQQLDEYGRLVAEGMKTDEHSPEDLLQMQEQAKQNAVLAEAYASGALKYVPGSGMPSPEEVKEQQTGFVQAAGRQYRTENGLPPGGQELQENSPEVGIGVDAMMLAKQIRERQSIGVENSPAQQQAYAMPQQSVGSSQDPALADMNRAVAIYNQVQQQERAKQLQGMGNVAFSITGPPIDRAKVA